MSVHYTTDITTFKSHPCSNTQKYHDPGSFPSPLQEPQTNTSSLAIPPSPQNQVRRFPSESPHSPQVTSVETVEDMASTMEPDSRDRSFPDPERIPEFLPFPLANPTMLTATSPHSRCALKLMVFRADSLIAPSQRFSAKSQRTSCDSRNGHAKYRLPK